MAQLKLDPVQARLHSAAGRADVAVQDGLDLLGGQFLGRMAARELAERRLARRDRAPGRIKVVRGVLLIGEEAAYAGVTELDGQLGDIPVYRGGGLREARYLVVVPQSGLGERRGDGTGVDVGAADDDQAEPAAGALPVVGRGQVVELRGLQ